MRRGVTVQSHRGARRLLTLLLAALFAGVFAAPAFAASDHELQFILEGRGRNPSVATIKAYILGCLPDGTRTFDDPDDSAGPWEVEVPALRGREYTNGAIHVLLMSNACAPVRPAKVIGVTVTDG
jgi:hypothetical protein